VRLLTVDGHWKVRRDLRRGLDIEAGLVFATPGRWTRLFAVWGEAPGSQMIGRHWTVWHTDTGTVHGWNARAGVWPQPCLTVLAHTDTTRRHPWLRPAACPHRYTRDHAVPR
jgi:hypothetical protein